MSASDGRAVGGVNFMSGAEVGSMMRVSKMTAYRLAPGGELPAVQIGRSFRVPQRAVDEDLNHSIVDTAADTA